MRILPRTHLVDSEADETEQRQEAADAQHQEPAIPLRQGHAAGSLGARRALPAPLNITSFAATPRYVPYGVYSLPYPRLQQDHEARDGLAEEGQPQQAQPQPVHMGA